MPLGKSGLAAVVMLLLGPTAAMALPARDFAIPPGRLGSAIVLFGEQADLSIGIADQSLGERMSRGVNGRFAPRAALKRLLSETGTIFEFYDARTIRVLAAPARALRQPRQSTSLAQLVPPDQGDIVVVASKQSTRFDSYAGSADVLVLDATRNARSAARGTSVILAGLPALASTNLGPGRNKLFIRGVADSSFNGPTQSTVGQYLGDARLTYNAPDPDLNLYDIDRVEVLSGPQGTLYGTGALGGIIRLMPNLPDASVSGGLASIGIAATRFGGASSDLAAMLNVPLVRDRLAIRVVGYRVSDAGYIDDPARTASNVNRTRNSGGRASLRYQPGGDWTIEAGGIYQDIAGRDGQYVLHGQPALTRTTQLAQPFDNDYRLGQLRAAKHWHDLELVSSTSLVLHNVKTRYDASLAGGPARLFEEDIRISLLSHETRLSGHRGAGNWLLAYSLLRDVESQRRRLGEPASPPSVIGVRNIVSEVAVFGQYILPLTPRLSVTVGARLNLSAADGSALDQRLPEADEPTRHETRISPSLALSWRSDDGLLMFVHYQEAARSGGLAVAPSPDGLGVQRFETDTISTLEAGARLHIPGHDRLAVSVTAYRSRWADIQADLVGASGLPFTANVGNGQIVGVDARVTWRPMPALSVEASGFLNQSALRDPLPMFAAVGKPELPNVAEGGGRLALSYERRLSQVAVLGLDASLRYVGRSRLGIGPPIDVSQGGYVESAIGARLGIGKAGLSLDITNLADVRGNRFAFGNPFGLADRNQVTPLRPLTIRIGVDASF